MHERYAVIEKQVGETPLFAMESWRASQPDLLGVPLAYAGRLDPMASGKLLILIGEECKRQSEYHGLDKEYEFQVLFGTHSDSGDVLGLIEESGAPQVDEGDLRRTLRAFPHHLTLPYPAYSSKTVDGVPLHTWAVTGRLNEIIIPSYQATVYWLRLKSFRNVTRQEVVEYALQKIETIPPVTDERKALGNDFRRTDVRAAWQKFATSGNPDDQFSIATIRTSVASGVYMRTLADEIAKRLNSHGLAYSIHRTKLGRYTSLPFGFGLWSKLYA